MNEEGAPRLTVVQPGQGREASLGGIGVVFKLFGEDTHQQLSIVEHPFPVGALVPPHIHTREDEYSIVLEGEIGFRSGDREAVLVQADTSPSRGTNSTPCGTRARCRPA
ncbi:hypothetical protein [Arthrobacter sp. NPDC057009]|uniref:hypothetical protein n=1 Tax=Arthrobacter sp. NPDC057009 TaxID=3345996 RepID=UPI003631D53F